MGKNTGSYSEHVEHLESNLSPFAKRSFENESRYFLDGGEIYVYYSKQWEDSLKASRLLKRTPLQIERDRVVHASITRKLTEKYQVLYNGQRKVVRNYATHVNRLVQVTRAMCRWLGLNSDFAEAIALGSKTGCLPFVHASKDAVANWVAKKIGEVDQEFAPNDPHADPEPIKQLILSFGETKLPRWISSLHSPRILEKVTRYVPWAAGLGLDSAYSTGQQGYWMLATNPFTLQSRPNSYCPETMYGVWRHSLGCPIGKHSFHHKMQLTNATSGRHEINWSHATYEALVVAFADDITWAIENLNDANTAALLNGKRGAFEALSAELGRDIPDGLLRALHEGDAGSLYTYFISDFNAHSEEVLKRLGDGAKFRAALREGAKEAAIGLSDDAAAQLGAIKEFLDKHVFKEPRVLYRTQMLKTLSEGCMDILYRGTEDLLPQYVNDKAHIERWSDENCDAARKMINDPIHRIQLAIDVFCGMGDQEIYDTVGIDSL